MISKAARSFWSNFNKLSPRLRKAAVDQFHLWREDPFHPSLHFKVIEGDLWSVRVTRGYRALARRKGELIVWFWIGNHQDYERLIN